MPTSATPDTIIRQIVDAMRTLAGSHPGFRPVHAKGVVCSGTFRAPAGAAGITRAPHFAGQSVSTIVRFANSNGNPDVHDGVPNVRSMAVKFQLSDGKSADILANSVERVRRANSRGHAGRPAPASRSRVPPLFWEARRRRNRSASPSNAAGPARCA
jgi:hypothetical protein